MHASSLLQMLLIVMIITASLFSSGCDNSCTTEDELECSSTGDLKKCVNGRWEYTDCFAEECEPNGYISGTCTTNDNSAECECGYDSEEE